jgi:hypothetical protein
MGQPVFSGILKKNKKLLKKFKEIEGKEKKLE